MTTDAEFIAELKASIAWVDQLNPSTNYEGDGAICHLTFKEFNRMRDCLGLRHAAPSKEKALTVTRRWERKAVARAEKAEAELAVLKDIHLCVLRIANEYIDELDAALAENARLTAAAVTGRSRHSSDE